MKKELHPTNYRPVVFKDMSNGHTFLSRSTAASGETVVFEEDGKEYPVIKLEISLVDTAGRIDKFKKRYEKRAK